MQTLASSRRSPSPVQSTAAVVYRAPSPGSPRIHRLAIEDAPRLLTHNVYQSQNYGAFMGLDDVFCRISDALARPNLSLKSQEWKVAKTVKENVYTTTLTCSVDTSTTVVITAKAVDCIAEYEPQQHRFRELTRTVDQKTKIELDVEVTCPTIVMGTFRLDTMDSKFFSIAAKLKDCCAKQGIDCEEVWAAWGDNIVERDGKLKGTFGNIELLASFEGSIDVNFRMCKEYGLLAFRGPKSVLGRLTFTMSVA
jgi:hypothetical protein